MSAPRAPVAALSLVHGAAFGAAAYFLPWPDLSVFAVACGLGAAAHLSTFVTAAVGARVWPALWRGTSTLSLGLFAYLTYASLSSGFYIANLYDGVGLALAGAAVAAWCVAVLFTVPLALWGLAATGGLWPGRRPGGRAPLGLVLLAVAAAFGAAHEGSRATARAPVPLDAVELDARLTALLTGLPRDRVSKAPQLFVAAPVQCDHAPGRYRGVTAFVTYLARGQGKEPRAAEACVQRADLDGTLAAVTGLLAEARVGGAVRVDVVTHARPLPDAGKLLGAVVLRPGLDGACDGARCHTPLELVGLDQFTRLASFSSIQLDLGSEATALRRAFADDPKAPVPASFLGVDAITTRAFVLDERGRAAPLERGQAPAPPLDAETVTRGVEAALGYVAAAQIPDGRFRYMVDPFTGKITFDGFSVPRQAGTTLALCELADHLRNARDVAKKTVAFLASLEQTHEERGGIVFPKGSTRNAGLGPTALTMVSLLACRALVGPDADRTIERLGRGLMAMQRDDGGFHPAFEPRTGRVLTGRDPMYAAGQAVMALVMLEGPLGDGLARPEGLRSAVDRAMTYYAGPYWDFALRDFFYLEENWHCLAARQALTHHRVDAYERFCLDYMTMKARLTNDAASGIDADLVGAYGFGHVFPPHHTATAGFGEALAAQIDLLDARGEPAEEQRALMRQTLRYLVHHQITEAECTHCTRAARIPGAFMEHGGSPEIRIDYVQHAVSALGQGGRTLGLLRPPRGKGRT